MKVPWLIGVFFLSLAVRAETPKEPKSETIPLDEIWALDMPGTRDVRDLEADAESGKDALIASIGRYLASGPPNKEKVTAGFAVRGTGLEALRQAHDVFVNGRKPLPSFSMGSDLSLVFFSYPSGSYIHLAEVVKSEGSIQLRYRIVPHETREMTVHFALIPISELPAGKTEVKIVRLPMAREFVEAGFTPVEKGGELQIVCRPFTFVINERNTR